MTFHLRRAVVGSAVHASWLLMAVVILGMADTVSAQSKAVDAAAVRPELLLLKSRVEQRFQVLLLRQGLVLVPKAHLKDVANIELNDGAVVVDGSPVTGAELKQRVGADAELVLQLSYLDAAVRRQLFEAPKKVLAADATPPSAAEPKEPERPKDSSPTGLSRPLVSDDESPRRDRIAHRGARVRFGTDLRVREGEEIAGDVIVIFGSAHIDGTVNGEVVAVGGGVYLGPKADVRGDVTSVGGGVERVESARVSGQINEVAFTTPSIRRLVHVRPWTSWTGWTGWATPFSASVELVGTLVRISVIGLLVALLTAVFPAPVQRVSERVSLEPWKAVLTGLAAQMLFLPLLVVTVLILAISIIGIPLLLIVPFVIVVALAALLLGFAGVGCAVGGQIGGRQTRDLRNLLGPLVVGLAIIWALPVIARFLGLAGMPLRVVVGGVLLVGIVVEYVAWTMGLGGVLLSRFGRRGLPVTVSEPPPPPLVPADPIPSESAPAPGV
ncbi:MAG: hypothetical protein WCP29_07245 [Acidobacteriota bacterium]